MAERFSKKTLATDLTNRIAYLEDKYGFVQSTGWAQLEKLARVTGRNYDELSREYGQYVAYLDLIDMYELHAHVDWEQVR